MVDWTNPWIMAQGAYPLVGMIVWLWVMGPLGMWDSPFLRLSLFLMTPLKIPIPTTARNAILMMPSALAALLLMFATFILWPIAALFALGWLACTPKK